MAVEVLLPVISAAGDEAVVTAWMVDEGTRVRAGQLIAEMQAEKVATDVFAPADGVVTGLVAVMQPVPQGSVICRIEESGAGAAAPPAGSGSLGRLFALPAARALDRSLAFRLGVGLR